MISPFIKLLLWSPFFFIALILGAFGKFFASLPSIFLPISEIFLIPSHFLYKCIVNDLIHSCKGTAMENILNKVIQDIENQNYE